MKAICLRTEYLKNPIGIDIVKPRLFWNCENGISQTAYQIVAKAESGEICWDSGKVENSCMRAEWNGKSLASRDKILWQVRLWDEKNEAGEWSEEATFEIGLLGKEDWKAEWITGDYRPKRRERYPVDCFQKEFEISDVSRGRLYITACGVYEARLNGERIGDFILAPGITDYKKRIQYQTYDVSELLQVGKNVLEIQVADGWYRGCVGAWGIRNQYGTETKLLAQLEYVENEEKKVICTDTTWRWSNDGSIRMADNKDGEVVDGRMMPSYNGFARKTDCKIIPTASNNVSVTEHEHFKATLYCSPSGKEILDFKQNFAGYISFRLNAKAGQKIVLRFGEMLDENGEFTQKNIQLSMKEKVTPLQRIEYTCKEGENHYQTKFAVFGFQYVLVETDVEYKAEDFEAIAVYSDLEETMEFECSNKLLNQFVHCTTWSAKSNSVDLPTDCPTRERHGWTGDAQIFCGTASYLFHYLPFARKYMNDVYDWQRKDGCLPHIAPEGGADFYMYVMNGASGWADAGILIPYFLWKHYGDREILLAHYDGMKKYAKFLQKRCRTWYPTAQRTGLTREQNLYINNGGPAYGEWTEPADVHEMTWKDCAVPHPEVSTAYTCYMMDCMAEIAAEVGEKREVIEYRDWAKNMRRSYQALVNQPKFTLDTNRQACLVRPLALKLLSEEQEAFAKKRLIEALDYYGWRLGTGFLSTPLILDVLSEIDIEYAYRLLENEEMPGWLFLPKNGATTVWESWEGILAQQGVASLNHYSKGAVCEWVFRVMCGIKVEGENYFTIAPRPGGSFTYAKLSYESIYGAVKSSWEKKEGKIYYHVEVPANTTAKVTLPNGEKHVVKAGRYCFMTAG